MSFDIENYWHNDMCSGNVIANHKGSISTDLITKTLVYVENLLLEKEENKKIRKKIYNILVEALQNLFHHALDINSNSDASKEDKFAMFALKKDTNYSFLSGNYVFTKNVQILKDRLDQINRLNPQQLKTLYQLILNNDEFSDKGGGGLGFVDIARKAKSKYEYEFHKLRDDVYFFSLKVVIMSDK